MSLQEGLDSICMPELDASLVSLQSLRFRVLGCGFWVLGLGFRGVWGLGACRGRAGCRGCICGSFWELWLKVGKLSGFILVQRAVGMAKIIVAFTDPLQACTQKALQCLGFRVQDLGFRV